MSADPETPDAPLPNDAFWFVRDEVLAGPYPGKPTRAEAEETLDALLDEGVRCFVDLTREGDGPEPGGLSPYEALLRERAEARGVDVWGVRLPIRDVGVPDPWEMRAILAVIAAARAAERPVYVHCWGGVGRTGTVLGCLAVESGMTPDEAMRHLAEVRKDTERGRDGRDAPETEEQIAFVRGWRAR